MRPLFPKSSPLSSDFSFYASLETFSARLTVSRGLILVILARLLANELQKQAKERSEPRKPRETKPFEDGQGRRCFIVIASWLVLGNVRRNLKKNFRNQLQAAADRRRATSC